MPLDAVVLTALTEELSAGITGMKIDKVQQPERDVVLLALRGASGSTRLLISAGVGTARLHITDSAFENPQTPPMFCMLLRKHLQGARISALVQPEMERLVILELDAFDEMGAPVTKRLIVEMMGRNSNIILADGEWRIIDCMRRIDGGDDGEKRRVLPGMFYRLPDSQEKTAFFSATAAQRRELWSMADGQRQADRWLLDTFSGLSPLVCRELCHRCFGDSSAVIAKLTEAEMNAFPAAMDALAEAVKNREFTPYMLLDDEKPRDFSFMAITQYTEELRGEIFGNFSELLDAFYTGREKAERVRRRAQTMIKAVRTARDRSARKLAAQQRELAETEDREQKKRCGDIITANMYRMKKGERELRTEDFYQDGCPEVCIPLDPLKTPQQNAAAYYKAYSKAKTAVGHLTEQIAMGEAAVDYLDSVLDEIDRAEGERDLSEIRRELTESGYIRQQKNVKKMKVPESKPLRFISDSGMEILVGRNNRQNDELTTKLARRTDVWLHTQKIHGSHVIISCGGEAPDETTIMQAASIAAFYSHGREGGKIPVDYTQVRFVKKPSGAMPGKVIYTDYKTIIAEADGKLAERLAVK